MRRSVCPPRRMRYSFESRCRLVALVLGGASPQAAAAACGASRATGYRLWRRYQEGGWPALVDRPPVPVRQPRRLSAAAEAEIVEAREYARAGPVIVGALLGRPASTVWKVLRRNGRSRLRRPAAEPVVRYERERPGELVHVDIKRLGRFWTIGKAILGDGLQRSRHAGWQYLHLAIDDHSRLAYAELLPSESPGDCVGFLRRAVAWYADQGVTIERVLSDNGNGYRSHAWAASCAELNIARRYTRPRRPQTNGKAEALVKTLLREWAYRFAYPTSSHRARALPGYLRWYNKHRPHSSIGRKPPISRVSQVRGSHT
ncbi:MAG TPA: IS481 family transposase [Chloroflexi bacterium]|nr:IS481 family transposase [Chloroflexota bacterium]